MSDPDITIATRYEDMSPDGYLRIMQQEDGDMIVTIFPEEDKRRSAFPSVEFCSCAGGGGRSPHTRAALQALMVAIQKDNAENPQRRVE